MGIGIEEIVTTDLKRILKRDIHIKQITCDKFIGLENALEDEGLMGVLNQVFYIIDKQIRYQRVTLEVNDARDYVRDRYFQANFTVDLSDSFYLLHSAHIDEMYMGVMVNQKDPQGAQIVKIGDYMYDLVSDDNDMGLGFKAHTTIIEHDNCRLHVIGSIDLKGQTLLNDIDYIFDPIVKLELKGMQDPYVLEKSYWLDYLLRAVISYEKENYISAYFNLFAGFDAFIECVNKKVFEYYLESYVSLKRSKYKLTNQKNKKDFGEDVQGYLIEEIKRFASDSRRLNDKLMSILQVLRIEKKTGRM